MKILVGVGHPEPGKAELELIAALGFRQPGLDLVNVVEAVDAMGLPADGYAFGNFAFQYIENLEESGKGALKKAAAYARQLGLAEVQCHQLHGYIANDLMKVADTWDTDLVAVASQKAGLASLLVGRTARKLAIGARQSVLIARPEFQRPWQGRAILAVDHSPYTERCVDLFLTMAPKGLTTIQVLTVLPSNQLETVRQLSTELPAGAAIDIEKALDERNNEICKKLAPLGARLESSVITGDVAESIRNAMTAGQGADLLILGAQGRGFFHRLFLGSTSLNQVDHGDYPLLLLRPAEAP